MRRRQLILTTLALAACRSGPPAPARRTTAPSAAPTGAPAPPGSIVLEGIPHVRQRPDFCGEAAAAAYLGKLGTAWSQDDVFAASGMDPARGMGATTRELATALTAIGFDVGPVWHHVAADAPTALEARWRAVLDDLHAGVPAIVCMRFDERPDTTEHFRLVVGYDAERDEVVYHEPAEDDGAYRRIARAAFLALWPLKYDDARWTVIHFRLAVTRLAPPPPSEPHPPAAFAQHVMELRRRAPDGMHVIVEPPFVVIGDEAPAVVARRAASTVRWAVTHLERTYFDRPPRRILDVWLFGNAESYRRHNRTLWGVEPDTPYGYYSPQQGALVMNIGTGGGTLVHEIVHPYVEANFPACPAWFNEGLGSLYEQSGERDGAIVGLPNWRLAGLQRAIARGSVPSFRTLTATSDHAFYEEDPGTNYAQARYLLYYLQEQRLLQTYYRAFVAGHATDPTGYANLVAVLGSPDMNRFQRSWEAWVQKLRFG